MLEEQGPCPIFNLQSVTPLQLRRTAKNFRQHSRQLLGTIYCSNRSPFHGQNTLYCPMVKCLNVRVLTLQGLSCRSPLSLSYPLTIKHRPDGNSLTKAILHLSLFTRNAINGICRHMPQRTSGFRTRLKNLNVKHFMFQVFPEGFHKKRISS